MTSSIIVAPPDLAFHSSEPVQKFEIYNVHQYPVKFVVKVTAPEKYIISNTEGMINTQCKVSISVTHMDICVTNENVRDKFRIYFSQLKNKKFEPIGHRDVNAVLYAHKREAQSQSGDSMSHRDSSSPVRRPAKPPSTSSWSAVAVPQSPSPQQESKPPSPEQGHNLLFYLVPIFLGAFALWLPTQGTVPDTPWYLELPMVTKNTVSFFLGILITLFYQRVQYAAR